MQQNRSPAARQRDQNVKAGQALTETWTVEFKRRRAGSPVEASLSWPHHTIYCCRGEGETVEEARLDLVAKLAHEVAVDADPFGDPE